MLRAFQIIYEYVPRRWPNDLQLASRHEFTVELTRGMAKHVVRIRRGNVNVPKYQGIIA